MGETPGYVPPDADQAEVESERLGNVLVLVRAIYRVEAVAMTVEQLLEAGQAIDSMVQAIPGRERRVINARYGLETGIAQTYKDIGVSMKKTAETARVLRHRGLNHLTHPSLRGALDRIVLPNNPAISLNGMEFGDHSFAFKRPPPRDEFRELSR